MDKLNLIVAIVIVAIVGVGSAGAALWFSEMQRQDLSDKREFLAMIEEAQLDCKLKYDLNSNSYHSCMAKVDETYQKFKGEFGL